MSGDPMRQRALGILREGRCSVVRAVDDEFHVPQRVMAIVRSSRPNHSPYAVELLRDGSWTCTCHAGMRDEPCAHVHAVQLVTTGVRVRQEANA